MRSAFNAMNRFEFVSDQYVELMLEHHMDGFFLNHIPLLRKLFLEFMRGINAIKGFAQLREATVYRGEAIHLHI